MLKFAILLFNTLALLMYQFLFSDGITVTQKVPSSGKAGSEFTVEITVNKGTSGGFAKLQEELPAGFTAVEENNNGASFSFNNQVVKFIWMTLPNDKEFKISYKVKVAPTASGDQNIAGKLSYVVDNVKQVAEIAPATISISAGDGAVATEPTNTQTTTTEPTNTTTTEPTNTQTTTAMTTTTAEPGNVNCSRKVPTGVAGEFTAEITISKGNLTGFAKLMEVLPTGFTASAGESGGASFSFADQKVRFIWVSMPPAPEIKISYKVTVAPGIIEDQIIDGVFSYIESDETKKFVLPTSTVTMSKDGGTVATTTTEPTNTQTTTEPTNTQTTTTTTEPKTYTVANGNKEPKVKEPKVKKVKEKKSSSQSYSATNLPSSNVKLHYSVQVIALQKKRRSTSYIANLYKINEPVRPDDGGGFYKYIVGEHDEYKAARDARETFKPKGVIAPFVTAYNRGRRITVQEALMVSSQKWYR